jgi:predicted enzyme related to lactoylglutathione lyase
MGELNSVDLLATAPNQLDFYVPTFDWSIAIRLPASPKGRYVRLTKAQYPVAGVMEAPPDLEGRTQWVPYFSVPDGDASTKVATELGAKVLIPPRDLPPAGVRFSVLLDPQGTPFGIAKRLGG